MSKFKIGEKVFVLPIEQQQGITFFGNMEDAIGQECTISDIDQGGGDYRLRETGRWYWMERSLEKVEQTPSDERANFEKSEIQDDQCNFASEAAINSKEKTEFQVKIAQEKSVKLAILKEKEQYRIQLICASLSSTMNTEGESCEDRCDRAIWDAKYIISKLFPE